MFMLDFILANEDRHLGNFGIIRDVETLEWISVCPVFDTGIGLNTNISKKYWLDEIVYMKFFASDFVSSDVVSDIFTLSITNQQIEEMYNVANLFEEIITLYHEELRLNDDDILLLKQSFINRIELFKNIMMKRCLIL